MATIAPMSIGLDIGATKIDAVRVEAGKVVQSAHVPTDKSSPHAFIKQVRGLIDELGGKVPVGIGIPGQIDAAKGVLFFAPNLGFKNIKIREELALEKVFLLNDVRAAGLAEWRFGEGRGLKNFVNVVLGTGIGGMVVADGKVIEGTQGLAGEVGHITVDYNGAPCTCGSIGCVETVASGWGIAKRSGMASALEAFEAKELGVISEAEKALVFLVKSLVNVYNPEKVILGGGVLKGFIGITPDFVERFEKAVKQQALGHFKVNIVRSKLENGAALGAAAFAKDSIS